MGFRGWEGEFLERSEGMSYFILVIGVNGFYLFIVGDGRGREVVLV